MLISCDCWRTTVATFWPPRRVVTLSKVSTTSPPRLTSSLNVSSPPSLAGWISTERPPCSGSFAEIVSASFSSSPAAGSSAIGVEAPLPEPLADEPPTRTT